MSSDPIRTAQQFRNELRWRKQEKTAKLVLFTGHAILGALILSSYGLFT